jgi:Fe-S cluster assembly protein SufD
MAEVTLIKNAAEQQLAAEWAGAKAKLPDAGPVREAAFARFAKAGLPTRRVEEWKYTDLRALMRDAKPLAPRPDAKVFARLKDAGAGLGDLEARRIVIADGYLTPDWTDNNTHHPGVTITELFAWLKDENLYRLSSLPEAARNDIAVSLNTAFMSGGVVIHVAKDACIEQPIHLAHVFSGATAAATYPRSIVIMEPGARLMLVESFEGPDGVDYQVNTALQIFAGEGAHADHIKVTREGDKALHVSSLMADVGAHARFNTFLFTSSGAVTRNQLFLRFGGEETIASIRGATLLKDKQHADTTVFVDHAAASCQSREVFKTVLDDQSRGIFQGKIIVQPGAQKTDAKMGSHALMLSEEAEADNKPELEIYADDVQCGHGATAGDLDEDLLFYLRARGIPQAEAEALLIQAFVGDAIEGIEHAGLREALMESVDAWLKGR